MTDLRDHDAAISVITMTGIRTLGILHRLFGEMLRALVDSASARASGEWVGYEPQMRSNLTI
jgi:hypothetical protein